MIYEELLKQIYEETLANHTKQAKKLCMTRISAF